MNHHGGSEAVAFLQTVTLEHVPCPLNCQSGDVHVLTGRDLLHDLPGQFDVVRCQGCGLMRTSPRPTAESIGAYYPADYGPYKGTRVDSLHQDVTSIKARLVAVAKKMFDTKAHALPVIPVGRMLEIGCASGSFLHEMAAKGWQVEGIEFSPEAAAAARALGHKVDTGAVESIEKPAATYDLIVGWMVLEHLHEPTASLLKLRGWAKPGAWLAVSVPDAGALEFAVFRHRWYALQLPTHLFHFDRDSIERVLDQSGWKLVSIHRHRSIANLVASVGYWIRDHVSRRLGENLIRYPERAGRVGALLAFLPALLLGGLGQTGRMTIWARRKQ